MVWAAKHFHPYLYGHSGVVYTDHEALKSLLNTPQPSGKLACWGMALQELDLTILHRSGKANANADAMSRCPQPTLDATELALPNQVVGNLSAEETEDLPVMQRSDPELRCVITYLETGVLPEEEKLARQVALIRSQYVIEDNGSTNWRVTESLVRYHPRHSEVRSVRKPTEDGSVPTSAL